MESNMQAQSNPFYDKVREYYDLKEKYEMDFKKLKAPILKNPQLSIKDKKEQLLQIRPKCINCFRPVGTKFDIIIASETNERILSAFCGDEVAPCPLKIELAMGDSKPLPEYIKEEEDRIKSLRDEVIHLKNQLLVGYISNNDVLERFDELKADINTSNQLLEYYLEIYTSLVDSPQMKTHLEDMDMNKYKLKEEMLFALNNYKKTKNTKFIHDAVEIYVNQFNPLFKTILKEKYAECTIYTEWETMTNLLYILIQNKTTLEELEHELIAPRILSFVVGYNAPMRARGPNRLNKTAKNRTPINPINKESVISSSQSSNPNSNEDYKESVNISE